MSEFEFRQDYHTFATSVRRRSRYVFELSVETFLQTVLETGQERKTTLTAGAILWRAQIGQGTNYQPYDPTDPDSGQMLIPAPHEPSRMKPLTDSATEGRVNPKGIPCLYLADDRDTAMAETRPWLGSMVSVAQFRMVRDLTIMDCSEGERFYPKLYFDPPHIQIREPAPSEKVKMVWGEIAYAFSEPVGRSESTADYAPTQVLAEIFRRDGCDGICYRSLLGAGQAFALFDLDAAEMLNCNLFEVESISFGFKQASNPYVIAKHYPNVKADADAE